MAERAGDWRELEPERVARLGEATTARSIHDVGDSERPLSSWGYTAHQAVLDGQYDLLSLGVMSDGESTPKEHLEMIQAVITRMGSNSFAVKTWSVGLVAALLTFAAEKDGNPRRVLVALVPVVIFWYLDGFYLRQERLFRRLYDAVRLGEESARQGGPFTMNTKPYEAEPNNKLSTAFWSTTVRTLYLALGFIVIAAYVIARINS